MDDEVTRKISREFRFQNDVPYDDPLIVSVGDIRKLKGHEEFVRAAKLVLEEVPAARFILVGKDRSRHKRNIKGLNSLTKELGVKDNFKFIEWMDDITPLLLAADVFVSCSRSESFGLTVLEAMARSKPIAATKTDGHMELLKDREDALLVNVEDPRGVADAVLELIDDQELSRNVGAAAKATAQERFSLDRMIDDTLRVYRYVWNS